MPRTVGIVVLAIVAFVAYSRLTAPSSHDQAVAGLARVLSRGTAAYTGLTCSADPARANAFAVTAYGSGVHVYDCRVATPAGVERWCVAIGGRLASNQVGVQRGTTCAHLGSVALPGGVSVPAG